MTGLHADRRHFVRTMTRILGGAAAFGVGANLTQAVAQGNGEINVGWLRLACTGQSFVGEGAGHRTSVELMMKHQLFNAGAETIEALGAGVLDASYLGTTPAVAAIARGLPVKIYIGGHKRGMGLVVRGDSSIKSISDLRGKNIATLGRGSLPDMQFRVTARQAGIDPDRDVNLLSLPSSEAVTALSKGSVDGLLNCPEWPQVALTSVKGSRFLLSDMEGTLWHGPDTQCVVVIVKDDYARQNPAVLRKLIEVHLKASRTMIDSPKESAKIIAKYEGAPPAATELALSHMDVTPVPSVDSIVKWRDTMAQFGMLKKKPKIDELLDLEPLRDVLKESGETKWLADLEEQEEKLRKVKQAEA